MKTVRMTLQPDLRERREAFGMAGVWNLWKNPKTDHYEQTFAILTGGPNEILRPIHDRMTTILEPHDYAEYLAPSERPPLHLLRILPADEMHVTPVTTPSTTTRRNLL